MGSGFYRATRMHSADYAVPRCLSIRLSHAGILSKRLNVSSKFFSPSGSETILVFFIPNGMAILWRGPPPLTGASNAREYEKNHDFRQISRLISEMMQDRAIVTMEGGYTLQVFEWYQFDRPWVTSNMKRRAVSATTNNINACRRTPLRGLQTRLRCIKSAKI